MTPRDRVLAVVAAGRRIADANDPLGREARERLPETSGLSPEGVELALTEHLETSPSEAELDAFVRAFEPAPRCHVVLSANVCTAALRALASAMATSEVVYVKPSRRDPVVAELLMRALAAEGGGLAAGGDEPPTAGAGRSAGEGRGVRNGPGVWLREVSAIAPEPGDEVHVYGSDETIAAIAATLAPGVVLRAHGTGLGVAVVEAEDDVGVAAGAIAEDLVVFDGRGCLSPRLVMTGGDPVALGRALHEALRSRGEAIPRGPLSAGERASLRATRSVYEAVGEAHEGPHHAVFVDPSPEAIALAPACRATVVLGGDVALLADIAAHVAAVGGDGPMTDSVSRMCPRARRSALGRMQKPPLDGPVDLR